MGPKKNKKQGGAKKKKQAKFASEKAQKASRIIEDKTFGSAYLWCFVSWGKGAHEQRG